MGTSKKKRQAAWKGTREGRRAHYFEPMVTGEFQDFDKSLCGKSYHHEHLDVILEPFPYKWRCKVCDKRLSAI